MAKKQKEETSSSVKEEVKSSPVEEQLIRPPKALPKRRPKPEPVFSFDRYFATLGKPAHWKAGMRAYITKKDLRSKKTVAEWDRLFQNY